VGVAFTVFDGLSLVALAITSWIDFRALCPLDVGDGVFSVAMIITLFFLFLVYVGFWAANAAPALQRRE
jgi:hypothetical protein